MKQQPRCDKCRSFIPFRKPARIRKFMRDGVCRVGLNFRPAKSDWRCSGFKRVKEVAQ